MRGWDVLVVGGGATGAGILRDLAMRGLRGLLIDKSDLGTGTSGRYHGLLHSGGRYVTRDVSAARECIHENRILRRIAAPAIEDTGGYFVQTRHDPDDYAEAFPAACAAAEVDCEPVDVRELLLLEPSLDPAIRRAFRVPDASLEPWQLIEANLADARARGSAARPYHELIGFERDGRRLLAAQVADVRAGTVERIPVPFVVSAAGAWAGRVAAMAGAPLTMSPGKGTMLIFNQRMTDACINRLHKPGDGDIMVPVGTVAILGTTETPVEDPDDNEVLAGEVEALLGEGEKLFPDLRRRRLLRAYAGARPLYDPSEASAGSAHDGAREISRSHAVIDHGPRDGIDNFVSIVGGKLTTYRLMAEQTVDRVAAKLGLGVECRTAEEPLPWRGPANRYHWLGQRLAEHEARGGGDADLICECELVTRDGLQALLAERWPCSLDDVRRATRLGMGPCQGGFCTFRAAGMVAERAAADPEAAEAAPAALAGPDGGIASIVDRAFADFLRERHRGTRPVAYGRQLQEWALSTAIQWGTLGVGSLVTGDASREVPLGARGPLPAAVPSATSTEPPAAGAGTRSRRAVR
jgi:glycerol-3-phosphate dehydrogenase